MATMQDNPFTQEQEDEMAASDAAINLPAGTTRRQFMVESRGNANAVSPKGARGYAQAMPATIAAVSQRLGRDLDPTNFDDALQIHRYVMSENMRHFGNAPDALRAYNGGWNKANWNNPETQAYAGKVLDDGESVVTSNDPMSFAPRSSVTGQAGGTAVDKAKALRDNAQGIAAAGADSISNDTVALDAHLGQNDLSLYSQQAQQNAGRVAETTHDAGFAESFIQAAQWDTIAGRMQDAFRQEQPVQGWAMSADQKDQVAQTGVLHDEHLAQYVAGSSSDAEWSRRMAMATQRLDFQERAQNTAGLAGFGNTVAQLGAGMGDPVMLAATLGAGTMANAARAAFAVRSGGLVAGAVEGAAGNMLASAAVTKMDNGDLHWPELFQNGLTGALLGGMGHALGMVKEWGAHEDLGGAAKAAGDHAKETLDNITGSAGHSMKSEDPMAGIIKDPLSDEQMRASVDGGSREGNIGIGEGHLADAFESVESRRAMREQIKQEEAAKVKAEKEGNMQANTDIHDAMDPAARAAAREAAGFERERVTPWIPEETLVEHEGKHVEVSDAVKAEEEQHPQEARIQPDAKIEYIDRAVRNPHLNAEQKAAAPTTTAGKLLGDLSENAKDPMVRAMAGRLREQLRDDVPVVEHAGAGRAHYSRATHTVHLFPEDAMRTGGLDPEATQLHEISHAVSAYKLDYGMRRPDSVHGGIVKQLEKLRRRARAEYKGNNPITKYYFQNAHEFLAGLYSGKSEFIEHLKSMRVQNGNVLSKTVDLVRSLLGLKPNETNALVKAIGLSDHLIAEPVEAHLLKDGTYNTVLSQPPVRDDVALGAMAQAMKDQIDKWVDVKPVETQRLRDWHANYYGAVRDSLKGAGKTALGWLDSVGLELGRSENKGVRMWASALGEDATGNNRQHATSAAITKAALTANFRKPMYEALERLMPTLMTAEEKVKFSQGIFANAAEKRIGREVAAERLARRDAIKRGVPHNSTASAGIRELSNILDGFWRDVTDAGRKAGDPYSESINKTGYVGHMPYAWDWQELTRLYNEDAGKFNSFKQALREQYRQKVLNPALDKMLKNGPVDQTAMGALNQHVIEHADNLTDRYLTQIMRDPDSRLKGADDHFGSVAADLLNEKWHGSKVTGVMAEDFKKALKDIISDRTRTEFDLLATQPDGTRLLDYMDTDMGRMVQRGSSKFAGKIALAKAGLTDDAHVTALKDALRATGASPKEVDGIDFLVRSLDDNLDNKEMPIARALQMGAHMSMMGKLGFNALADSASVAASAGVSGFFRTLAGGLGKDTALLKQLGTDLAGALGSDHSLRVSETSAGTALHTGSALSDSAMWRRAGDVASDAVGKLSGAHYITQLVHRGAVPVLAEDLMAAIRGSKIEGGVIKSAGGMNPARLVDSGLTADHVARIKDMLETHDTARKRGDRVNWDSWSDQGAADDLRSAIHRVTAQALQRSFVGETPRWLSEGTIGKIAGQFKRYGILAAEKQLMRNALISDANTYTGFAMATAWGAMLYYLKAQASMAGMDQAQRDKYMKENMTGAKLASGVFVMVNMSGLLPDGLDTANMLMGGQSHASGSPVASIGFLENLGKAAGGIGGSALGAVNGGTNPLTGKSVDYASNFRNALRIMPGANTIMGSAVANLTR